MAKSTDYKARHSANTAVSVSVGGYGGGTGEIDLSEFPLRYSAPIKMSDDVRNAVEAFEKKHAKGKIEFGTLIASDGSVLEEARGGKGSVRMSTRMYNRAEAMSHIHPRSGPEVGVLGGTFSPADLSVFYSTDIKTMRAKALEGVYSIQKMAGFDAIGNGSAFVRAYQGGGEQAGSAEGC